MVSFKMISQIKIEDIEEQQQKDFLNNIDNLKFDYSRQLSNEPHKYETQ